MTLMEEFERIMRDRYGDTPPGHCGGVHLSLFVAGVTMGVSRPADLDVAREMMALISKYGPSGVLR